MSWRWSLSVSKHVGVPFSDKTKKIVVLMVSGNFDIHKSVHRDTIMKITKMNYID